ncbi:histidine kinase [Microbacterium sp. 22242]|uniref:sensor histidine kinase n=1 Tax=Microbacterium sp. 22242 TaxID=3453896 RepID=UPI003F86642E
MWGALRVARGRAGWRDRVIDVAPATGLWLAGLLDIAFGLSDAVGSASAFTTVVPMSAICALLVFRRWAPLPVLGGILAVIAVPVWFLSLDLGYWGEFVPWLVALYSCARHEHRAVPRAAGLALSAVALAVIALRFPQMANPGDLLYDGALLVAAWMLGLFARSWARYRDDALRQEAERSQAEARARQTERVRIARELHDVISHTITVVVMQAGGARLAAERDPAIAPQALARIETLGQESLAELRTLLAVLREDDAQGEPGEPGPQPGLDQLPALCDRMRALGLPVRLHGATGAALPPGVQLAAYRIVQEALTNVLKHAGAAETDVTIGPLGDGTLVVEIVNAAPARPRSLLAGPRRGLTGMTERVAALGGEVAFVPHDDGGFAVHARLPTRERAR